MSILQYNLNDNFYGQELSHTPEGVRDLYGRECAEKIALQRKIQDVLRLYGFEDIQTPSFEFFDIFNKERGTIASRHMYKFFDREGNTLVLRPDITPSIARCVAKYYKDEVLPIRLSYMGNTFVNNSSYQGKLKEVTQIGAELILDGTSDADAEMIALTIECLKEAGLKEFQIDLGHAGFFEGITEEAGLEQAEIQELRVLMEKKNLFGVEEIISSKEMNPQLKELFLRLPELFGSREHLQYAEKRTKNQKALDALDRLEKLYGIMENYGFESYVTFDLGMLSNYQYYTGVVFRAYTYGTGEVIATGGRYDRLLSQFGKDAEAIGVAIVVDQLMIAMNRQKLAIDTTPVEQVVLYHSSERCQAIALAGHYRSQGQSTRLVRQSSEQALEEYVTFAKANGVQHLIYLYDSENAKVYDLIKDSLSDSTVQSLLNCTTEKEEIR